MPKITIEISDALKEKIQQQAMVSLRSFSKQVVYCLYQANGLQLTVSERVRREPAQSRAALPKPALNVTMKHCRKCSESIPLEEYNDFGGYCEQHGKKIA